MNRYKWELRRAGTYTHPDDFGLQIPELTARILASRGFFQSEDVKKFLNPSAEDLHDPFLMRDMDKAVERILEAIDNCEKIAVYGDYDVDGITSTYILSDWLCGCGVDCLYYIPGRLEEGYGLNTRAVDFFKKRGVTLIITVDTGVSSVNEIEYAASLGIDVVVTDHHTVGNKIPPAFAVVNPRRSDCDYPFKELAGVGVVLKLICALEGAGQEEALERFGEFAALGTIADVMSLTGENRIIVAKGIEALSKTKNFGMRALIHAAGYDERPISALAAGFTLSPRLNAAGRMASATLAVELFLSGNEEEACGLALKLCDLNRKRQELEGQIYTECHESLQKEPKVPPIIILKNKNWHNGIIGIVASRLCNKFARPVILFCEENGICKGSGRSPSGFNLFNAISSCRNLLETFGGHDLAAGLTLKTENFENFCKDLNKYVRELPEECSKAPPLLLDLEISVGDITLQCAREIEAFEPCGQGNPIPLFLISNVCICELFNVGGGNHLRISFEKGRKKLTAICFGKNTETFSLRAGDRADFAVTLSVNEYRGADTISVQVHRFRAHDDTYENEFAKFESFMLGKYEFEEGSVPSREELAALWRYLSGAAAEKPLVRTVSALSYVLSGSSGVHRSVFKTLIALEFFAEFRLIEYNMIGDAATVSLLDSQNKGNIEASKTFAKLKGLKGEQK